MKKQIFSSKIVYFSIFLIFICFSFWGIKNVGAKILYMQGQESDPMSTIQIGTTSSCPVTSPACNVTITGVHAPTQNYDAVNKGYLDSIVPTTGGWTATGNYVYLTTISNSVGIGTAVPGAQLDVVQSSNGQVLPLRLFNPSTGADAEVGILFDIHSDPSNTKYEGKIVLDRTAGASGGLMRFYTSSGTGLDERMVIDNSGQVGIGTTIPQAGIHVWNKQVMTTDSSGNYLVPTDDRHLTPKKYVDDVISAVVVSGDNDWAGVGGNPTLDGDIYHTGKVGIGTTIPSAPLHIKSTTSPQLKIEYDAGRYVTIDHAGDITNNDNTGANPITFTTGGSGAGSHDIIFKPEGTELVRMTADTSGVGIGTTIPEGKLSVVGDVGIGAMANTDQASHMLDIASTKGSTGFSAIRALYPSGGGLAGTEFGALANRDGEWKAVYAKAGTGGAIALYTDGEVNMMNGNVGIGTTSPSTLLNLYNSGMDGPNITLTGNTLSYRGVVVKSNINGSENWFYGPNTLNNFVIRNAGATDYVTVLNSNGNVGIGVTTPGYALTTKPSTDGDAISWQRNADGHEVGRLGVTGGSGTSRYGWMGLFNASGTQTVQLDAGGGNSYINSGNVGIGTTNPGTLLTLYASATDSTGGIKMYHSTLNTRLSYWSQQQFAMQNPTTGNYENMLDAIAREKQIKGGSRKKKLAMIEHMNPDWRDLYQDLL